MKRLVCSVLAVAASVLVVAAVAAAAVLGAVAADWTARSPVPWAAPLAAGFVYAVVLGVMAWAAAVWLDDVPGEKPEDGRI